VLKTVPIEKIPIQNVSTNNLPLMDTQQKFIKDSGSGCAAIGFYYSVGSLLGRLFFTL